MENVEIKGVENFSEEQKYFLNEIVNTNYEKIKRKIKNDFILKLTIKEYSHNKGDDKDKSIKFSIHAEIKTSAKIFEASDADWNMNKALHKVFNSLQSEIEHRFHVSEQRK